MVGLDAAGKTTILYKLKLGEIVTTIPTIGEPSLYLSISILTEKSCILWILLISSPYHLKISEKD